MSYYVVPASEGLGFSLKPPKWLRKMQPGKLLEKAAIPLAIVGGALLIPGVGGALISAATAVGGAAAAAGGAVVAGTEAVGSGALKFGKAVLPIAKTAITPPIGSPSAGVALPQPQLAMMPQNSAVPVLQAGVGSSAQSVNVPNWVLPAGLLAVAAMMLMSKPGRR